MTTALYRLTSLAAICGLLLSNPHLLPAGAERAATLNYEAFRNPSPEFRGRAMWGFDLSSVTEAEVKSGVRDLARAGYGGFLITVFGANGSHLDPAYFRQAKPFFGLSDHGIEYMSEPFFHLYGTAIEEAKAAGLSSFVLYDDYNYPTGNLCGELFEKYPQYMAKRLDMLEEDVTGPAQMNLAIPAGTYIGSVAVNLATFQRDDISDHASHGNLRYDVPPGKWKVMLF